jgi:hypothetical protein
VTDDQYNALVFQHVEELWTRFGNLTEIWWVDCMPQQNDQSPTVLSPTRFDHGYDTSQKQALEQLLAKYQPHASGFNGQGLVGTRGVCESNPLLFFPPSPSPLFRCPARSSGAAQRAAILATRSGAPAATPALAILLPRITGKWCMKNITAFVTSPPHHPPQPHWR